MSLLPPQFFKHALSTGFEWLLNQSLLLDEDNGTSFLTLDQSVIQLSFSDLKQTFFIVTQTQNVNVTSAAIRFSVETHLLGEANVDIQCKFKNFLKLKTQYNKTDFSFKGDETLAQTFLEGLHRLKPDWEEALSQITGDFVAHKIGTQIESIAHKKNDLKQQVKQTIKEYLQFEVDLLPTRSEMDYLTHQLNELTHKTQQLEKKSQSLLQAKS